MWQALLIERMCDNETLQIFIVGHQAGRTLVGRMPSEVSKGREHRRCSASAAAGVNVPARTSARMSTKPLSACHAPTQFSAELESAAFVALHVSRFTHAALQVTCCIT